MRLEQLRKAYKIAKNVSVDYKDMTPEEVEELDDALDIIFKLERLKIEEAETKEITELKEELEKLETGNEVKAGVMTVNEYISKKEALVKKIKELEEVELL